MLFIVDTMVITKLETRLWWPSLTDGVEKIVNSCVGCQRSKTSAMKSASLLQSLEIP